MFLHVSWQLRKGKLTVLILYVRVGFDKSVDDACLKLRSKFRGAQSRLQSEGRADLRRVSIYIAPDTRHY